MTNPVRLQLSRRKGWNLQAASLQRNGLPAIKVDRSTWWGNPFIVGKHGTADECAALYRHLMEGHMAISLDKACCDAQIVTYRFVKRNRAALRGKNLACWCQAHKPCHADVLLMIANSEATQST